ncbi:sulfurtransferase [Bacillus sp. FJAT-29937]|uniref:sulfurtransferase n=1 Tax=Bacillus sp. FJAT-29937 TaxID=1720553 RepID=UPI00082D100C|nr:sulfurtransferase [Bacillus sp. FJAT-29937]
MGDIIKPETLANWLEKDELTIIDVRSDLLNPDEGEIAYKKNHIPGAHYLHLTKDLSGEVRKHGGNHPLPDKNAFTGKLSEIGVTMEKPIVIYDTKNEMFAARAWWLLKYYGHNKTYLLDGGFDAWVKAGYEVTDQLPEKVHSTFTPQMDKTMVVSMEDVKNHQQQHTILIDSRSRERYLGESEPLYKKAGHIPGAKNYFWQDVLVEDGSWKTPEQLKEHFAAIPKQKEVIVSCGSGISACPNIVALKQAGFNNVKLYAGSFSDWISYEENEVVKGE